MSKALHYADSDEQRIRSAKLQIAYLLQHRTGKRKAISSKGLAEATGLKATTVRDLIPEIRRERQIPIASCPSGYYVIDSKDDFLEHMNRIEETIETKKQRQSELARAFYNNNQGDFENA